VIVAKCAARNPIARNILAKQRAPVPSEANASMIDGSGQIPADHPAAALLASLIDEAWSVDALLAALRSHQVAPAAVSSVLGVRRPELVGTAPWRDAVERNRSRGARIARARTLTEAALLPVADRVALPSTTLGPLWVHDVDVLVHSDGIDEGSRALRDAGFLDVNALLARIGRVTPGVRRFGATDEHDVLASVELCTRTHLLGPSSDAAVERAVESGSGLPRLADRDAAVRRCIKVAAARHVTLRGAFELLALVERLPEIPRDPDVAVAFRRCAALERRLAGPGTLTEVSAHLPRAVNRRYLPMRANGVRRALRRRLRPRRMRIAFSGIEGAGKSTQTELLTDRLRRLDIPAVAARTHAGPSPAGGTTHLGLRRRVGRAPRAAVIVHDRGPVDALVDLELGGRGAADPEMQRRLPLRTVPHADLTFYLRVPPTAAERRLDDALPAGTFEEAARLYDRVARGSPGVVVIDGVRPPPELCGEALMRLAGASGSPPAGDVARRPS
jgi:thymidylate kinase